MIFFRLEELAPEDLRKLIMSQDPIKMHGFLQFIFNTEELRTNGVKDGWMELYDFTYIDDKILGGLDKNLANVAQILA